MRGAKTSTGRTIREGNGRGGGGGAEDESKKEKIDGKINVRKEGQHVPSWKDSRGGRGQQGGGGLEKGKATPKTIRKSPIRVVARLEGQVLLGGGLWPVPQKSAELLHKINGRANCG